MHPMSVPVRENWPHRQTGRETLSTIVYRSHAACDMSPQALRDLTFTSERRNRREAITGLMLYDGGQFFQSLEGPPDSLDRVMRSIRQDTRHRDIEVLNHQRVESRTFGEWGMKLAVERQKVSPWRLNPFHDDVIEAPSAIVAALCRNPYDAPFLLRQLVRANSAAALDMGALEPANEAPLHPGTAGALRSVLLSIVIPQLCRPDAPAGPIGVDAIKADPRAQELAALLIGWEDRAALELIREIRGTALGTEIPYTSLLEPAARRLGDLWSDDICSEFDLTLGLCRLQTAVRLLTTGQATDAYHRLPQPTVLIVPEPGELHLLGSALDSNVLNRAGWEPQSEFPRNNSSLQDLVSSSWFDVLDVSLSVALRRDHLVPRVAETISQARRASQNPDLLVVVGGRVFREKEDAGHYVGANLASKTAGNVDQSILRTMNEANTRTDTFERSREVIATAS
jgi:hypothetical protein